MTTLAVDKPRKYEIGERGSSPVIASDIIYEGAAVGDNGSGYARPLVAGDTFLGIAERTVDNSNGASGDLNVRLIKRGRIEISVASVAITDVGKPVYASDDDTFVLTATSNTLIGTVDRFVSSGVAVVYFHVPRPVPSIAAADLGSNSVTTVKILDSNVTTAKIADSNVTLGKLAAGVSPSHVTKYAGLFTWAGSGVAATATVAGVVATDVVQATIKVAPTQAAYIKSVASGTDSIVINLSAANTSNDAVLYYQVQRAAS